MMAKKNKTKDKSALENDVLVEDVVEESEVEDLLSKIFLMMNLLRKTSMRKFIN
jgi:hypothetical protein